MFLEGTLTQFPTYEEMREAFNTQARVMEKQARRQRRPFIVMLGVAWFMSIIATGVLAYFAWQALDALMPSLGPFSLGIAVVIQAGAIGGFHFFFDCLHKGINNWLSSTARIIMILFSTILFILAAVRYWMQWTDNADMPIFLIALLVVAISLVDPVISWLVGMWTAGATHAKSFHDELYKLSLAYRNNLAHSMDAEARWMDTVNQAKEKQAALESQAIPHDEREKERVRREEIDRVWKPWLDMLRNAHPSPGSGLPPIEEGYRNSSQLGPSDR